MRRQRGVCLMLVLLLVVGLSGPAWAGGTDDPGMGSTGESTTMDSGLAPATGKAIGWVRVLGLLLSNPFLI